MVYRRTVPAVIVGIALGPIAASFLSVDRWIDSISEHRNAITLVCSIRSSILRPTADDLGLVSCRHWRAAGHCRLSITGQVSAATMGRNVTFALPHHDNHVALHHRMHHARDTKPQFRMWNLQRIYISLLHARKSRFLMFLPTVGRLSHRCLRYLYRPDLVSGSSKRPILRQIRSTSSSRDHIVRSRS